MIVLDTNVISEALKSEPSRVVMDWLDRHVDLTITAVTLGELRYGIARLPDGGRKAALGIALDGMLAEDFDCPVLAYDAAAAVRYGDIVASRERAGHPVGGADAQIAAICAVHSVPLATRNLRDFDGTGVELIDPWTWHRPG